MDFALLIHFQMSSWQWQAQTSYSPPNTTVSSTLKFALVFVVKYPEVQSKMQQEIDKVVGRDRMPTLDDRARSVEISVLIKNIIKNRVVLT